MNQGLKAISAMATKLAIKSNEVCKKAELDDVQTATLTEYIVSEQMKAVIDSAFSDSSAAEFTNRLKIIGDRFEARESLSSPRITSNEPERIVLTYRATKKE